MQYIDITKEISENTFIYPGDPKTILKDHATHDRDGFHLTELNMGLHTGTHIDYPKHFIKNGKTSSDFQDPNLFFGNCLITDSEHLDQALEQCQEENLSVLFIKNKDRDVFSRSYRTINAEQLEKILKLSLHFLGIDTATIEPAESSKNIQDFHVHKRLLEKNILIIENLELEKTACGVYQYIILPLKLKETEASPVRVFVAK